MPAGPGKYGEDATEIHVRYGADVTMLCVLGGEKGEGFSVVGGGSIHIRMLIGALEYVIEQLRKDVAKIGTEGEA